MSRPPLAVRAILAVAALVVPAHRRPAWRLQWEADLAYRRRLRGSAGQVRFTLGALPHAIYLRKEDVGMRGLLGDLRTSVRSLLRRPTFTLVSVLTLGVGIGAATAVFSMAEAVLIRPLAVPGGERLVRLFSSNPREGMSRFSVSYPDFVDWTARSDLFESASLYTGSERDLASETESTRIEGAFVHDDFFETLEASAVVGRLLGPDDQNPASPATVVLSEDLWTRLFAADPRIVGTTVRLDGRPYTVVGIVSRDATWPLGSDFWIPLQVGGSPDESMARRSNHAWQAVARLRTGVEIPHASSQVAAIARAWYESNGVGGEVGTEAVVVPLRASVAGDEGPRIFGIMGLAVLVVLLIACINQSNLLLTHAMGRARELSLRSALGAARLRLIGSLLTESVVLSLAGGVLGLAFAAGTVWAVTTRVPLDLPSLGEVRLNGTVLLGALLISLLASLLAGLVPALRASRTSVADALREGAAHASEGRSGVRLRKGLVTVELALSVVLLTAAGLAIRTFQAQLEADPGFRTEHALVFSVRLPSTRYGDEDIERQFYDEAVRRLEAIPGVTGAGITSNLPVGATRGGLFRVFLLEGSPEPPAAEDVGARWVMASPSYFTALGVAPLRGRTFTLEDGAESTPVMVVTESFARRISPEQEILGRRIRSWRDENLLREVVGVVPDIQIESTAGEEQPVVFVPASQDTRSSAAFMVRTAGDPAHLIASVRSTMAELDREVALAELRTLEDAHRESLGGVRFVMTLFGFFGALALALAVVGVYALVAHAVARRTREIGIRLAMGATGADVEGGVVKEGLVLAALGIGVGLLASAVVARVASSMVPGIPWLDVRTFVGVAVLLGGATVLASWIPARRVLRVDPVRALKAG